MKTIPCVVCKSKGKVEKLYTCNDCLGYRKDECWKCEGKGKLKLYEKCVYCGGSKFIKY